MKTDSRWPNLKFPNKAIMPTNDAEFEESEELHKIREAARVAGRKFKKIFGIKDPTDI
jgi:hypothetical protein